MYTLRRILPDGTEMNFNLGESYVVTHSHTASDYPKMANDYFRSDEELKDKHYAFITDVNSHLIPLQKGCKYYIVTERGNTFDNLSI